ncbi:hypothetical protein HanPSC8_Chr08g0324371 [Helianthus annuus]|nr:hypothetical protein HanPSC8_Chr08g0324371 [Helianthus annuus]
MLQQLGFQFQCSSLRFQISKLGLFKDCYLSEDWNMLDWVRKLLGIVLT